MGDSPSRGCARRLSRPMTWRAAERPPRMRNAASTALVTSLLLALVGISLAVSERAHVRVSLGVARRYVRSSHMAVSMSNAAASRRSYLVFEFAAKSSEEIDCRHPI